MKSVKFISIFVLAITALFVACSDPADDNNVKPPPGNGSTTYTVTFDKNHDDADNFTEASPQTKSVTTPATTIDALPTAPTREGYNFTGWNTEDDGTGSAFTASTPVTANVTVFAQWQSDSAFDIVLEIIDGEGDDSVTVSLGSGQGTNEIQDVEEGDEITISYTLDDTKTNNQLVFTGVSSAPSAITSATTDTWTYTVDADDAINGTITIKATFTHSAKQIDTIAFVDSGHVTTTYGEAAFTRVATTGSGSGTIAYSSSEPTVATVNTTTGEVTILKVGETTITATRAEDNTYAEVEVSYELVVEKLLLTISDPTATPKTYDGTATLPTANVSIGSLTNKVGSDDVTVLVESATYNSADVLTATTITVVYTISGNDAGNYNKPVNSEISGTITKADGATLTGTLTATPTETTITLAGVSNTSGNGQTIEYALLETSSEPSSGWKDSPLFENLTADTTYYGFARAKADNNHNIGTVVTGIFSTEAEPVVEPPVPPLVVDFETLVTHGGFGGQGGVATTTIITDPANSNEKSLQVTLPSGNNNWGAGAYVIMNLPFALQNYQSFSFKFYLPNSTAISNANALKVYAAASTYTMSGQFIDNTNGTNYLVGTATPSTGNWTTEYAKKDQWLEYEINIGTLPSGIQNLSGDIKLIIGLNHGNQITYLLDDFTFNINNTFEPGSLINPTTATFEKNTGTPNNNDITINMNLYGNTLAGVKNGSTPLTQGTDYTVNGETVTLLKSYLMSQSVGNITLTFDFNRGGTFKNSQNIVITIVVLDSVISPTTALFVKDADTPSLDYKDIEVTLTLNGNTLSNIKNGETTLIPGTDYTYATGSSTVTLLKEYLEDLDDGSATLTFNFSSGASNSIVITISENDPPTSFLKYVFAIDGTYSPSSDVVNVTTTLLDANMRTTTADTTTLESNGLHVNANGSNLVILPFTLEPGTNLSQYTIQALVAGVSPNDNNLNYKQLLVVVGQNEGVFPGNGGNQTIQITNFGGVNIISGTSIQNTVNGFVNPGGVKANLSGVPNTGTPAINSRTGTVQIGFYVNSANIVYRIIRLELIRN